MLHLTVSDVLHGDWDKLDRANEPFCIYVVREGNIVFYVGRSSDPFTRLYNHFSTKYGGAALGLFYRQYRSRAVCWQIDLYTLEDCLPHISHVFQPERNIAGVEVAMIQHFKPCLNVLNNPEPSSLPEEYTSLANSEINNLADNAVDYLDL